jgi:citrate lyase subunit beta / citryl-CoA lyase
VMTSRSYLYVPGHRAELFARAFDRSADELIFDLEDAVPLAAKEPARRELAAWLPTAPRPVWVRVNPGQLGDEDIAVLGELVGVRGFCLAKAASREHVAAVSAALDAVDSRAALAPVLEDAAAFLDARAIAAVPRVERLQLGEADLRAQLGITPGPDESELLALRTQLVLVSAAAGIDPPLGPATTNFTDLAALGASTERLRRLGFAGRACIHPAQVPVVNDVFTPTEDEVQAAADLVRRIEAAAGAVTTGADGAMIDEAIARSARAVLARAARVGTRAGKSQQAGPRSST